MLNAQSNWQKLFSRPQNGFQRRFCQTTCARFRFKHRLFNVENGQRRNRRCQPLQQLESKSRKRPKVLPPHTVDVFDKNMFFHVFGWCLRDFAFDSSFTLCAMHTVHASADAHPPEVENWTVPASPVCTDSQAPNFNPYRNKFKTFVIAGDDSKTEKTLLFSEFQFANWNRLCWPKGSPVAHNVARFFTIKHEKISKNFFQYINQVCPSTVWPFQAKKSPISVKLKNFVPKCLCFPLFEEWQPHSRF